MPAYKDNKGRWFVKFYCETWNGDKKQILKRGFETKKEALQYEHEYKANKSHSPDITVRTLYNEFIEDYKDNARPTSYKVTKCILKRHVVPYFGDIPINEITPIMCRKWQNEIKAKNQKNNTQKNIEMCFRKMLNFAVKYYNLPKNPFSQVTTIGRLENKKEVVTLDEFRELQKHYNDVTEKAMFNLLFYSGIRLSELRGISPSDVDFTACKIDINKQMQQDTPAPLKTGHSKRVISLPKFVLDDVKEFFDSFYSLPAYPFSVYANNTIRKKLRKLCKSAGVMTITPHVLRHSHATLLITNHIPINIISKRLGHANITTTLNVYSHCFKDSEDDVVSLLELVSNQYQQENKTSESIDK